MSASTDGWMRVSGGANYVADVRVPDALHVAFLYSPLPHARVVSIDLRPALDMPGVVDAVSARELGEVLVGRALRDYPVLAGERVLFSGQRVAAVAAVDRETAQAAAALIEVEYEEIDPILDLETARAVGEDLLHPRYAAYAGAVPNRPGPNTQGVWDHVSGDVDAAFADEHRIVDRMFRVRRSHSAPVEPHACVVWAGSDRIDIWATNKEPYNLRRSIAEMAGTDVGNVRVHLSPIGGDFGSKGFPYVELACYALSARTGRPVRHTMSYYEELTTTAARHPLTMRLRVSVDSAGRLRDLDADTALDGGAFGAIKAAPMVVVPVIHAPLASYALASRQERCVSYYSNTLPGGHVRSPGEFQALFAAESLVDIVASELGKDPIEFRLANAAGPRVQRVLQELQTEVVKWRAEAPPGTGIGVALCFRDTGSGRTTVRCTIDRAGVEISASVVDQGAGSYTLFRRLAAETLAVPLESVRVRAVAVGSDDALQDAGAGASRVTAVAGRAVIESCRAAVAEIGGLPEETATGGYWPAVRLSAIGRESVAAEGSAAGSWPAPPDADVRSHAGVAVELSVDTVTGELSVHRALLVADTGRVFNPVAHRGQLEGGFIYGLSQALLEELIVEQGRVTTATLRDYRLATAADVPPLDIRVLEPAPGMEDAILSVGELANVGVAPALANAIHDAVGVRLYELPITPELILQGLEQES